LLVFTKYVIDNFVRMEVGNPIYHCDLECIVPIIQQGVGRGEFSTGGSSQCCHCDWIHYRRCALVMDLCSWNSFSYKVHRV